MRAKDTPVPRPLGARERILRTAHDLFYREGVRATGIDRVIAEAEVTKATFYRHFPSKNDLVHQFLEYRHQLWMAWFVDALRRHGNRAEAISPVLAEWFRADEFRGCAFINSLGELGTVLPEIADVTRNHKRDMTSVIASLLPSSRRRKQDAEALALAVDGAIIRAQFDQTPVAALAALERILNSLLAAGKPR